jgi:hypothetical protein
MAGAAGPPCQVATRMTVAACGELELELEIHVVMSDES